MKAAQSETGHAKNLANFDNLRTSVASLGETYNPARESIRMAALNLLSTDARNILTTVSNAQAVYSNVVAARDVAFKPLSMLATRLINALKANNTSVQVDDNARTLVRKIQGSRASARLTDEEKATLLAEGKEVNEISTSQMSFDSRLENFLKLVQLLSSIPLYTPNEPEFQVAGLQATYNDLNDKNAAVIASTINLANTRIARNNFFYRPDSGLVDTASAVKAYIKSLFGATSPQYRQVSGLVFRSVKI